VALIQLRYAVADYYSCGDGELKWTPFVGPRTVRIKVEVACSFLFSSSSKTL
jgi:hypothetical protein